MIISASRRTDIPAFYSPWLINRLRAGFVDVKNPVNPKQISRIPLNREVVDCLVFWTKNVNPMLGQLSVIDGLGYPYYFQFTLTPYDHRVERHIGDKREILAGFKRLSERIGRQRVIWRYDPVIISGEFPVEYHLAAFARLSRALDGYTTRCVFSFLDFYAKIRKRAAAVAAGEPSVDEMEKVARGFAEIAHRQGLTLATCSEQIDLAKYGIDHAACIDPQIIEEIIGCPVAARKDPYQRPPCGCCESIDIGAYDSCPQGCVYCYATLSEPTVYSNRRRHDSKSSLLIGQPDPGQVVANRTVKSLRERQVRLVSEAEGKNRPDTTKIEENLL